MRGLTPSIRLELMADPVAVVVDGDREVVKRWVSGDLLRLLYWAKRPIELDRHLEALGQAGARVLGGRDTFVNDARSALRDIANVKTRLVLASRAQHGQPARYQLHSAGWKLDVEDFLPGAESAQLAIEDFRDDLFSAPEKVSSDFDKDLETWIAAFKMWGANPGVDLANTDAKFEYDIFHKLYQDLVAAIVVAYAARFLRSGNQHDLTLAMNYYDPRQQIDVAVWRLGFRVAASMTGGRIGVEALKVRLQEAVKEVPAELLEVIAAAESHAEGTVLVPSVEVSADEVRGGPAPTLDENAPLYADPGDVREQRETPSNVPSALLQQAPQAANDLLRVAALLGIADHSALALQTSNVTPTQCCRDVVRTLKFSGIMANKWVLREDAYEAFDELLTDLDRHGEKGLVRLMIVDPDGAAAPVLRRRGLLTEKELASLPVLKDLLRRHRSFQVRMYDTMPTFRIIIVDNTYVTVAPYLNLVKALPESGWEVPQLALTPNARFPFAQAFTTFFDEAWSRSEKKL